MSNSNSYNSMISHSSSATSAGAVHMHEEMSFNDRHYRPEGVGDAPSALNSDNTHPHSGSMTRNSPPPRSPPLRGRGRGRGNGRWSPPPGYNPNPNNIPSPAGPMSMSTYPKTPAAELPGPGSWLESRHHERERLPHDRVREPRYPGAGAGRGGFDGERRGGHPPREGREREREHRENWPRERDAPPHQYDARMPPPPEPAYDSRRMDGAYDARNPDYSRERDPPPHVRHSNSSSNLTQGQGARDREPIHHDREPPMHREREQPREPPIHRDQPQPPRSAPIMSAPSTLTLHPYFRLRHSSLFSRVV